MKKSDIETIVLQEAEIKRLRAENSLLWASTLSKDKRISELMTEVRRLKKRENELAEVNV